MMLRCNFAIFDTFLCSYNCRCRIAFPEMNRIYEFHIFQKYPSAPFFKYEKPVIMLICVLILLCLMPFCVVISYCRNACRLNCLPLLSDRLISVQSCNLLLSSVFTFFSLFYSCFESLSLFLVHCLCFLSV